MVLPSPHSASPLEIHSSAVCEVRLVDCIVESSLNTQGTSLPCVSDPLSSLASKIEEMLVALLLVFRSGHTMGVYESSKTLVPLAPRVLVSVVFVVPSSDYIGTLDTRCRLLHRLCRFVVHMRGAPLFVLRVLSGWVSALPAAIPVLDSAPHLHVVLLLLTHCPVSSRHRLHTNTRPVLLLLLL